MEWKFSCWPPKAHACSSLPCELVRLLPSIRQWRHGTGIGHRHRFLSTSAAWTHCNSISRNHFIFGFLLYFLAPENPLCVCTRSYVRYLFSFFVGPVKANLTNHQEQCLSRTRLQATDYLIHSSAFFSISPISISTWALVYAFLLFFYWRKVQMIVCSNKSLREHHIIQ